VSVWVWMSVIRGCYMSSVNDNLQIYNLVLLHVYVCVALAEIEERGNYSSWRVAEDGGKKL